MGVVLRSGAWFSNGPWSFGRCTAVRNTLGDSYRSAFYLIRGRATTWAGLGHVGGPWSLGRCLVALWAIPSHFLGRFRWVSSYTPRDSEGNAGRQVSDPRSEPLWSALLLWRPPVLSDGRGWVVHHLLLPTYGRSLHSRLDRLTQWPIHIWASRTHEF